MNTTINTQTSSNAAGFFSFSNLLTQAVRDSSFGKTEYLQKEYTKSDLARRAESSELESRSLSASQQQIKAYDRTTGSHGATEMGPNTSPFASAGLRVSAFAPIRA